jgi:hypothetical protein
VRRKHRHDPVGRDSRIAELKGIVGFRRHAARRKEAIHLRFRIHVMMTHRFPFGTVTGDK